MNDLVVNPDKSVPGADDYAGARGLASAQALAQSETDLEKGLNGTVMALDILAMVANPLKEFMMAGVGFLIEHVGPLRDFLDILAGDPDSINATKETWQNIQEAMGQAAADLVEDSNSMSEWTGDAADAYRGTISEFHKAIETGASSAGSIAKYLECMGIWTAVTRGLVLELICDFVSRAIMYALSALASAWFTFGGSIAAMVSAVIADAMVLISRLGEKIARLGQAMQGLMPRFSKLSEALDDAGKALSKFGAKVDGTFKGMHDDVLKSGTSGLPFKQFDFQHSIYDTMSDPFGSGNIPGTSAGTGVVNQNVTPGLQWRDLNLIDGKNVGDIIGGYPMTAGKGAMGGAPDAVQEGD